MQSIDRTHITEGHDGAEPCGLDRRVEYGCAVGLFLVLVVPYVQHSASVFCRTGLPS